MIGEPVRNGFHRTLIRDWKLLTGRIAFGGLVSARCCATARGHLGDTDCRQTIAHRGVFAGGKDELCLGKGKAEDTIKSNKELVVNRVRRLEPLGRVVNPGQAEGDRAVGVPIVKIGGMTHHGGEIIERIGKAKEESEPEAVHSGLCRPIEGFESPVVPGLAASWVVLGVEGLIVGLLVEGDAAGPRFHQPGVVCSRLGGNLYRSGHTASSQIFDHFTVILRRRQFREIAAHKEDMAKTAVDEDVCFKL